MWGRRGFSALLIGLVTAATGWWQFGLGPGPPVSDRVAMDGDGHTDMFAIRFGGDIRIWRGDGARGLAEQ